MPAWGGTARLARCVVGAEESSLDEALKVERQVVHKVAAGKHRLEGMMAFLEKRKPDFSTDPDQASLGGLN